MRLQKRAKLSLRCLVGDICTPGIRPEVADFDYGAVSDRPDFSFSAIQRRRPAHLQNPMNEHKSVKLHHWDDMEPEALSPLITRKMMWGDKVMLSQVFIKEGGVVPLHQHENEQFSYMISGSMKFWLEHDGGEEIIVRAGDVLHLPSNVPHGAVALEDALSLDVFSPPRADWIAGTDAYLRGDAETP